MKDLVLIFDFDGTIADTHHYIVEISNRLCEEFGYRDIKPHEVTKLKDKTSQQVIGILRVPVFKIPALLSRAKKEFLKGLDHLHPFEGLKDVLERLKKEHCRIGILSSNAPENIKSFLKNHNMEIFDFIHTTSMVWTKNTSLKRLIETNHFDKNKTFYIGDETRDVDAARKLWIKVIAVTWGYNSAKVLKKRRPHFLVHNPEELYHLCKEQANKLAKH